MSVPMICLASLLFTAPNVAPNNVSYSLEDIHIRDPFIVSVPQEKQYYLFGSHPPEQKDFPVYVSRDLKTWHNPTSVFTPPEGFWATRDFWAPEVHWYHGRYYMFASFKSEKACRGTQILVADAPAGPYRVHSNGPVTPSDWECLDGTLFVDKDDTPWMVFCHEWLQIGDGAICAIKLSRDLSKAEGSPMTLFHASDHPLVVEFGGKTERGKVTDGPFLYRTAKGALLMIWASFSKTGYMELLAKSESGTLAGPWKQFSEPLLENDSGHGMIFKTFAGKLKMILHHPNSSPNERAILLDVIDTDEGTLKVTKAHL